MSLSELGAESTWAVIPGKVICNECNDDTPESPGPGMMETLSSAELSLSSLPSIDSHSALSSVKKISADNEDV